MNTVSTRNPLDEIEPELNQHTQDSQQSGKLLARGVHSTFAEDLCPYISIKPIADLISQYRGFPFAENGSVSAMDDDTKLRTYAIIRDIMNYFELPLSESIKSHEQLDELIEFFPDVTRLNLTNLTKFDHMSKISRLIHLNYLNLMGSRCNFDIYTGRSVLNEAFQGRNCDQFTLISEFGKTYVGKIQTIESENRVFHNQNTKTLLMEIDDEFVDVQFDKFTEGNYIKIETTVSYQHEEGLRLLNEGWGFQKEKTIKEVTIDGDEEEGLFKRAKLFEGVHLYKYISGLQSVDRIKNGVVVERDGNPVEMDEEKEQDE